MITVAGALQNASRNKKQSSQQKNNRLGHTDQSLESGKDLVVFGSGEP